MKTKPTKIEKQETTPAAAAVPAEAKAEFLQVLKRQLHVSPTNPRKDFPEASLAEMAASEEKHGIIQPLIVRRWAEKDRADEPAFEIVCGERRFRASERVPSLTWIPVIVRVMSDTDVLEIQLIENLQREDVSPYDEAVGYASLLALQSPDGSKLYTVDRIAEKIGKEVSYVRNRLKMQRTPKVLLEALRKGLVGTRVCEIVGRIPHAEDRERCAAEVLEHPHYDRPMSIEETQAHIHEEYMLPLSAAPFDRKAADLLPKAGSCEDCPFRTGNDPELEAELVVSLSGKDRGTKSGIGPQICQNPKCYRDKCDAHLAKVKAAAPERVLDDAGAKTVFDDWGHVKHTSKLKKASDKPGYQDVGHWDTNKLKTWAAYAKKLEVPVVLAKHPKTGAVIELVDISAVKAAEKAAAPEKPVFLVAKSGGSKDAQKSYEQKERQRRELQAEEVRVAYDRVSHHLVGNVGTEELLTILEGAVDHQGIDVMVRWMNLKVGAPKKVGYVVSNRAHKVEAILEAVKGDPEHYDREGILILILMAQFAEGCSYNGIDSARFKAFAAAKGVDFKEIKTTAKLVVSDRRKEKKAKAGKKGAKGPKAQGKESSVEAPPATTSNAEKGEAKPRKRGVKQIDAGSPVVDPPATVPPVTKSGDLEADIWVVVAHFGKIGGTVSIDAVKIQQQLGWTNDRCISVVNELRGRKMLVMGCLERDSLQVKRILAEAEVFPEDVPKGITADVPSSGKSKLAAAAAKKAQAGKGKPTVGAPSEGWLASPDLEKHEKLLGKLLKAIKTWGPETIFDATWVKAWVAGVKDDKTAEVLLEEAVHRGAIAADQVVMKAE